MKNQPTRTCMGCNEKKAKNEMKEEHIFHNGYNYNEC